MLKELFDRTLAALGLLLCTPVFLGLGLLIKLETPGPVFFKHRRVGKDGRLFEMYKFRKMRHDCNNGPKISPKYDPRLTRVGRVMERLKLDELPQLINIFKGEMSFVGPRPEIPEIVSLYTHEQRRLLSVKPGLVGPNQIVWRNEKNLIPENVSDIEAYYVQHILPQKLERDLRYVARANLALDVKYFLLALAATLLEPLRPVHFLRRKREILRLAVDLGLCQLAFGAALLLKYDWPVGATRMHAAFTLLPLLTALRLTALVFLGVSQQTWQFAGRTDLLMISKAVLLPTVGTAALAALARGIGVPLTLLLIEAMLSIGCLTGWRLFWGQRQGRDPLTSGAAAHNLFIYGANAEGELLLRRIHARLGPWGVPVGFLDGDVARRGSTIHGLPVLGTAADLPYLVRVHEIREVYVAADRYDEADLQQLQDLCEQLQISCRFVTTTVSTRSEHVPSPPAVRARQVARAAK